MKNRYLIYFVIMVIFVSVFSVSCKKKEEPKKEEDRKPPQSLEQVQELTEEIVKKTVEKDWLLSTEKTKELHMKWNEFYPDAQKKGLPKEKADEFNRDLNRLTDLLISKSLSLAKQKPEGMKEEEGKEKGSKEEGSKEEESKEDNKEDNKEENGEDKGKEQKQDDSKESKDKDAKDEEENKDKEDPKKVLEKAVPLVTANAKDLIIINASIELTKHIPIFMSLFESEVPPNVMKLKYLVRHIDVSSKLQKWDIAAVDIKEALETWVYIQPKVIEVKDTLAIQVQQSLTELVEVVELKDSTLTTIKSDVVIKNIEKIVDEFKKKAEQEEEK